MWGLTLPLFLRLWDRHRENELRQDRRSGEVVAMLLNTKRAKSTDRVWKWTDIYPEHEPPKGPQTEEEMLAAMEMWAVGARSTE